MRLPQTQMKLLVFLLWLTNSHKSLKEVADAKDEGSEEYLKLLKTSEALLQSFGDLRKYQNYYPIAHRLNLQIERMKRALDTMLDETEGRGCVLMILIVGALRQCDLSKIKGFEDLKSIDLSLIIKEAREGGYLNSFGMQKLGRDFKFGYWEA